MTPSLQHNGFLAVQGLLAPPWAHAIYQTLLLRHWRGETVPDSQFPTSSAVAGDVLTDVMLLQLQPRVEQAAGCALLPTYGYARVYFQGDVMMRHVDRPSCEISVAIHLGRSGGEGGLWFQPGCHLPLEVGDGAVFLGSEIGHWRETFEGQTLGEMYLHYVRKDGPQAGLAFDGLPERFPPAVAAQALGTR